MNDNLTITKPKTPKFYFNPDLEKEKNDCPMIKKLCAWRHDMPPPLSSPLGAPAPRAPPSRRNVAVVSYAHYVLTITAAPASRVKAAVSKAA